MSKYLFEGDFKRKPEQRLGGRSKVDSRNVIIHKAQEERNKRERDRQRAAATLKIQAYTRGYLVRCSNKSVWRNEFDRGIREATVTVDRIGELLKRINLFYDNRYDNVRLHEIGKKILAHHSSISPKLQMDSTWHVRMKRFLKNCLVGVSQDDHLLRTLLRLMEVFTDPRNMNLQVIPSKSLNFIPALWIELVDRNNFFRKWRSLMGRQLEGDRDYKLNPLPLAVSLVQLLQKPLAIARTLDEIPDFGIVIEGNRISSHAAASSIMKKFILTFSQSGSDGRLSGDPLISNIVIPNLQSDFPHRLLVETLRNLDFVGNQRRMLFVSLSLMTEYIPSLPVTSVELERFMDFVLKYSTSFDPRLIPTKRPRQEADSDDEDSDDDVMQVDQEEIMSKTECFQVLELLYQILNKCETLEQFFTQNNSAAWVKYSKIICCAFSHLSHAAWEKLRFLASLSYRKAFLRNIYEKIFRDGTSNYDEVTSFCWMYLNSTVALHDQEFLSVNALSVPELANLVVLLRNCLTDVVMSDQDETEGVAGFTNKSVVKVLMALHRRNTRLMFLQEDSFISSSLAIQLPLETHNIFFEDFDSEYAIDRLSITEKRLRRVLIEFPFLLSFHDRVAAAHRLINVDRSHRFMPYDLNAHHVQIRRNYIYEDAFEKLSVDNVPDMRGNVRISLVNVVGVPEAGVDGGGLLRDFLTEATRAGVDPNRGLFRLDTQNRLYPNPIAKEIVPEYRKHFYLIGRLVGKALYEQTLLELPLAAFFLESCISGRVSGAVDYLATLDPALHKNLLALRDYTQDELTALGLDFTLTIDRLGDASTVDLKPGGSTIMVSVENRIEYIHLVADYKINRETAEMCIYFRDGLTSVCPIPRLFTWRELQTLISGSDRPIDVDDWMSHTNYTGGYNEQHPVIVSFWETVRGFDEKTLRKLLKFVTSCSRPPLLGFKDLVPNFGIQNAGVTDRLPSAATCMNLLKLPEYSDPALLKEKLIYAVEAQAGFELS